LGCTEITPTNLQLVNTCFLRSVLVSTGLICALMSDLEGAEGDPVPSSISAEYGSIHGLITFQGAVPKSLLPDDAGYRRDRLQVDRKTRGLAGVTLWLEMEKPPGDTLNQKPPQEAVSELPPVIMDQFDHTFVPRVVAVRAGQPVKFINSDPANHNVRTSSRQSTNEFNVFTGLDGSYLHRFAAEPARRPVRVSCDIHPWMRGWIYVFDQPWFSVTDKQGRFNMNKVPVGRHRIFLRQPDIRYQAEQEIVVEAGKRTILNLEVSVPDKSASEKPSPGK
jgi:plastocyanin